MKNTITNLIAVVVVSLGSAAFAAGEAKSPAQPAPAMPAPAASAVPPAAAAEVESAAPAEKPQPAEKPATPGKRAKTKVRPKNMDLRHCLELDNNPAIARCAYE